MEERMKKIKGFLLFFVCCLLSCLTALMFTACTKESADKTDGQTVGSDGGNQSAAADTGSDTVTYLNSLQVDYADAKREFTIGQEFTSDGLKVTALITEQGTSISTNSVDVTKDAEIDASAFNNKKAGDYKIYISYTYGGTTLYANYTVKVVSAIEGTIAGLVMDYDGDRQTELSVDVTKASIDLSSLKVSLITGENANNTQTEELARSAYSLSYSKDGGEFNPIAEDKTAITDLTRGTYSFFASAEYKEGEETFTMTSFFTFYVLDPVVSLTKNEGGKTSFDYDTDEVIGGDWTYTATYASGATQQLGYEDVEIGSTVNDEEGTHSVTVTYAEEQLGFDVSSNDAVSQKYTQTCDVSYEIGENPNAGSEVTESFSVDFADSEKGWGLTKDTKIPSITLSPDGTYNGTGSVISLISTKSEAKAKDKATTAEDGTQFTKAVQMGTIGESKAWAIDLTDYDATATATIKVYASTSSNGTARTIVLNTTLSAADPIATSEGMSVDSTAYLTEWEVTGGAIYYIGSANSSVNYFALEVSVTFTSGTPVTSESFSVDFADSEKGWGLTKDTKIPSITLSPDGTYNGTGSVISLISTKSEAKAKDKATTAEDGTQFTKAVQMGTIGESKAWAIDLTDYDATATATIKVYASTSSNGTARTIVLNTTLSAADPIATSEGMSVDSTAYLTEWEVTGGAIYYIGSANSSVNYFRIVVEVQG